MIWTVNKPGPYQVGEGVVVTLDSSAEETGNDPITLAIQIGDPEDETIIAIPLGGSAPAIVGDQIFRWIIMIPEFAAGPFQFLADPPGYALLDPATRILSDGTVGNPDAPKFDFIPIIMEDAGAASISVVSISGVSTAHGAGHTDHGRIYGRLSDDGANWKIDLFATFEKASGDKVATGSVAKVDAGTVFDLTPVNGSAIYGKSRIASAGNLPADFVAIVTFATDPDVMSDADAIARFPGHDDVYGLARFHSRAMKIILASALPAAAPHLYTASPVSPFISPTNGSLPDLTKIANPEALRQAQADLVRYLSAKEKRYLEEWAIIAEAAEEDYEKSMALIKESNKPAETIAEAEAGGGSGVTFGRFARG